MLKEAGEESGEVSRHALWKVARINKKKNASNERVEEVFTQCEEILSQADESGNSDERHVLNTVLKKDMYRGHVRGMGFGVYPGQYFKPPPKPKEDVVSKEQYDHVFEEWREMKSGW